MRLSKKLLIFFGILFLFSIFPLVSCVEGQANIVDPTHDNPTECASGTICKRIGRQETETGLCYGPACYTIHNLGFTSYFIPLNSPGEFYNFLVFARNNPTILYVTPTHCVKKIAEERDLNVALSSNQPIYYGRSFFENTNLGGGVYKIHSAPYLHYTFKLVNAGKFDCTNTFFGEDPYPHKTKDCYIAVACPGAVTTSPSGSGSTGGETGGSSGGSSGGTTASTCVSPMFECGGSCCGPSQKCYQNSCCTPSYPPSSSDYSCASSYSVSDGCGGYHSGTGSYCSDHAPCYSSGCGAGLEDPIPYEGEFELE